MKPHRARYAALLVTGLAGLLAAACGGDSGSESGAPASSQPTSAPAAQATAAPTSRPVAVTQEMLGQISINAQEVGGLYGSTPFTQTRSNVTDIPSAFSSSPELGALLTSQNVTGTYNAWSATAACTVCAIQVPAMIFPNEAAAGMAYDRIRQVNQSIFQNVQPADGFGNYWNASFCQNGTFTNQAGQTLNWMFCATRKGNAVITVAIGGLNFNQGQVGTAVRGYATRVENYLKTQFP